MDLPSGFKRWRFHWFQCPACGHHALRAYAHISIAHQPTRMLWRFWCERCAAYSTLKQPMMPAIVAALVLLFVGPVAFAFLYPAVSAGLRFEWLIVILASFWLSYPLVFLALTRWMYRYVPVAQ